MGKKHLRKTCRLGQGQHPLMEKVLLEWINQKRIFGIAISGPIIKEKALEFNRQQIYEHRLLVSSSTADEIHKKYSALGKMYYNNKYIFCVDT